MAHPHAKLTIYARRLLIQRVVREGWCVAQAAFAAGISRACAYKWLRRYHDLGDAGLADRSSRPMQSPRALEDLVYAQIVALRHATGDGPARIAQAVGCAASTVYRTLRKHRLHRLDHLDRITRTIVRYERSQPGELLHLDVKQLWRIPDGGGRRFDAVSKHDHRHRGQGHDFVHVAIDDYTRYLYVEALPDQTGVTTAAFLERALAHLAALGIRVERILTDNGLNYRSRPFYAVAATHGIVLKRTRPYRPQTNGKAERVIQTLLREWAYRRPYDSNRARHDALGLYQHLYNHSRPHAALGHRPPVSRICQQPV
jgi:transposase InsO family protein